MADQHIIEVQDGRVTLNAEAAVEHIRATFDEDDLSTEDSQDASDAARSLAQVRRLFRGTSFEALLTEVIKVCDAVAAATET